VTAMGSMGLLLADWSVELFRARRRKAKVAKQEKVHQNKGQQEKVHQNKGQQEKGQEQPEQDEQSGKCPGCLAVGRELEEAVGCLAEGGREAGDLCSLAEAGLLVEAVAKLVTTAKTLRDQVEECKEEGRRMAESVGRQLEDRDLVHNERVASLDSLMAEKERQLHQSAELLRQQLTQGKKEREQLQKRLDQRQEEIKTKSVEGGSGGQWEAECQSLRLVIDIRREEADQLRAANNSLRLEIERFQGLEAQLQVQKQRAEELGLVVGLKNDQLRQVLDEYDCVQQQLEVEVSAHLACQQELERSQWVADTILSPVQQTTAREKTWKNLSNQAESGLILDVVQKGEKGVAYSFNC